MNNKRIFAAVQPLAQKIGQRLAEEEKRGPRSPDHKSPPYADIYTRIYTEALQRLEQHDVLTLDAAAELMDLTPESYVRKADRGQAVLIEIEGHSFVPRFTLDTRYKNARIKPFQVAIAKEFSESGDHEFFKFISYLKFMNQKLDMEVSLPERRLPEIFKAAGVSKGKARVILSVPMTEIANRALKNPQIMTEFINHIGAALTRIGGMGNPNDGGLTEDFLSRYVPADIPGRDRWKREFA